MKYFDELKRAMEWLAPKGLLWKFHGEKIFISKRNKSVVQLSCYNEFIVHLGEQISRALASRKISEEDILNEFRQY